MNSTIRFASVIFAILAISPLTLEAQTKKKCDVSVVLATQNKVGKLTSNDVKAFLFTFGKECDNNVEFSEFSNEVLFQIFDKQTDLVLKTMVKEEKQFDMEEILITLSSPINDMINIRQLLSNVDKVKTNSVLKKKVIEQLKIAESNAH